MAYDEYYRKPKPFDPDAEDDGSSGEQGSGIEFHDFIGLGGESREKLPPEVQARKLNEHEAANKDHVEKEAEKLKNYEDLKNGKRSISEHRQEQMANREGNVLPHPAFENDPRMAGIDSKTSPLPSENNNEANEKDQNELKLQYQLQNQPKYQPGNTYQPPRLTK